MPDPQIVQNPQLTEQITQLNKLLQQLSEGGSHLVTGGMAAHALEWLKKKDGINKIWVQLSDRTKTLFSALVAALSGAGIVLTFQHPGNGHYILDIDHLTLATFGLFLWSALQNWLWQQGWYMSVIKPKPVVGPVPAPVGQPQPHVEPVPVVVADPHATP